MTRLDRIIKLIHDYDYLVEELELRNNDTNQHHVLETLRKESSLLIEELKRYGCRREF